MKQIRKSSIKKILKDSNKKIEEQYHLKEYYLLFEKNNCLKLIFFLKKNYEY